MQRTGTLRRSCFLVAAATLLAASNGNPGAEPRRAGKAKKGELLALSGDTLSQIRVFRGRQRGDSFGGSIGFDVVPIKRRAALVIGAPGANEGAGQLRVVDHDTRATILAVEPEDLASASAGRLGHAIVDLGHINNSAAVHWAVAAPGDSSSGSAGAAPAVIFLSESERRLVERARATGPEGSLFGWALAGVDHADFGDSIISFLAVGSPREANGSETENGAVYVYDSVTGELIWRRSGERENERFGFFLTAGPDYDGDGVVDLWVGAPGRQDRMPAGRVYLVSGATGRIQRVIDAPARAALFGFAVAARRTANGHGDLLIGAPATKIRKMKNAGAAYWMPAQGNNRILRGQTQEEWFGVNVSFITDRDGDGQLDAIVSSLDGSDDRRTDRRGRVSFVSTGTGERLQELTGKRAGDHFGVALFGLMIDFNDDGVFDFIASRTRAPLPFIPD